MKNKKGFSTIELLVSFVIVSFISIAMFRTVLILNDKLFYYEGTTKMIVFNGTFTNGMAKDLMSNQIDAINTCGTNCYDISYQSLTTKRLKMDTTNGTLQYGEIVQKLPQDAKFNGNITFTNNIISGIGTGKKNTILSVTIPIISDVIEGDYSINVVYQYDSRLISFPMPLISRFSATSAGANEAEGTYQFKNGSYYFVGGNPNNWIQFGQVSATDTTPLMWRIIKNDNDGIKIIYEGVKNGVNQPTANGKATINGLTDMMWDTNNSNKWENPASAKTYINTWYRNLYVPNKDNYVNPIQWCIGATGNGINYSIDPVTLNNYKSAECVNGTYAGGTFNGKTDDASAVGLILPSDYISTSSAVTCTGSYQASGNNNGADCGKLSAGTVTNFLYKNYNWWTIEARATDATFVWRVDSSGYLAGGTSTNNNYSMRPVVNLDPDVIYTGGDGSIGDPYTITNPITLLSSKFTAASASANGASGTYATKNGSNYFVGANPNNWVQLGQVSSSNATPLLWRVIRSDNEGIKIIYEGALNGTNQPTDNGRIQISGSWTTPWDTTGSNNWSRPATIKAVVQSWYDSLYIPNKNEYMMPINWCIGGVLGLGVNPVPLAQFKSTECTTNGAYPGTTSDTLSFGFIKPSDYISTSSASTCTGSWQSSGNNSGNDCGILTDGTVTNFLYKSSYIWWTLNAGTDSSSYIWYLYTGGSVAEKVASDTGTSIRPVLNLNPNVLYSSGDGRLINPYRLALP